MQMSKKMFLNNKVGDLLLTTDLHFDNNSKIRDCHKYINIGTTVNESGRI